MNQLSVESSVKTKERKIIPPDVKERETFEFPLPPPRVQIRVAQEKEAKGRDRDRFEDPDLSYCFRRLRSYAGIAARTARFVVRWAMGKIPILERYRPHDLSPTFFGLNCPPSLCQDIEDFLFRCIGEIGVGTVRVDWGPETDRDAMVRWMTRLTGAGIEPLVHLVQPHSEASRMHSTEVRKRWEDFLGEVIHLCHGRVKSFEIGSTPNRHSWSGYTLYDYIEAGRIAQDVASREGVEIVGPNVTDFAPYFSIALLEACRKHGIKFGAMTNNLFCDRAGSPEAYDPSVGRSLLGEYLKMDVVGKSALLWSVARAHDIPRMYSTYSYYTLNQWGRPRCSRKRRNRHVTLEDYSCRLVKYYVLSAAAGAMDRVYWGNIACNRKGVVDDGCGRHPYPPHVHHKYHNYGTVQDYRKRESFQAFKTLVQQIKGSQFTRALSIRDPFVFEFRRNGTTTIVAWSSKPQGEAAPQLDEIRDRDCVALDQKGREVNLPTSIHLNESPLYLIRNS